MPRPLDFNNDDWSMLTPDREESELDYKHLDQIEVFDIVARRQQDEVPSLSKEEIRASDDPLSLVISRLLRERGIDQ